MQHKRTKRVLQTKKVYKKHKKILPHHHTGRIVHHQHTSYGALALLILFVVGTLCLASRGIAEASGDPVTGSITNYAVVPAPRPDTAPRITSPGTNTDFTSSDPVQVSGTCPDKLLIKIYKNSILAGATFCQNKQFSVQIDLFPGLNNIIARAYNTSNIASPDSNMVTLTRTISGLTDVGSLSGQFFITSDVYYLGVRVGETLKLTLNVSGGQAPYAINIGWGDGKNDVISRGQAGTFVVEHVYDKPGHGDNNSYDITVQASDQQGKKSFIHLVTIVSGDQSGVINNVKAGYNWSTPLKLAWWLLIIVALIVLSFWLGERYKQHVLKKRYNF